MPKSYRNANTEMRAHFDEMQAEVEHKVEEAMASFREERLRTQTRRPPEPAPPPPATKRSASRLPWLIGAGGIAMLAALGSLRLHAPDATPTAALPQATATLLPPTAAPSAPPRRALRATPMPTLAPTLAPPADSATETLANPQVGLDAITTPAITPAKPRPRAKPTRAQRYSEDLSDLLQRR